MANCARVQLSLLADIKACLALDKLAYLIGGFLPCKVSACLLACYVDDAAVHVFASATDGIALARNNDVVNAVFGGEAHRRGAAAEELIVIIHEEVCAAEAVPIIARNRLGKY